MTKAPSAVDEKQLEELGIEIKKAAEEMKGVHQSE